VISVIVKAEEMISPTFFLLFSSTTLLLSIYPCSASDDGTGKKPIRVVTVLLEPFAMLRRGCEEPVTDVMEKQCVGNSRYEGYCMGLLKLVAERMGAGEKD